MPHLQTGRNSRVIGTSTGACVLDLSARVSHPSGVFPVLLNGFLVWLRGRFASVALGQPCSVDSTDYVSPGPNGQEFITTVIRHNCRTPQLFCNPASQLCEVTKPLGSKCSYDQECQSVRSIVSVIRGSLPIANLQV